MIKAEPLNLEIVLAATKNKDKKTIIYIIIIYINIINNV